MGKTKHIGLLAGGLSFEREISFMSAEYIEQELKKIGYKVSLIDPADNLFKKLQEIKPDLVFNCLHGTYGEDGVICGVLEMLEIPYTHSGVTASAIAMNKTLTKKIAESCGIRTAKSVRISKQNLLLMFEKGIDPLPIPYVIKPEQQGSAIGVYIIKDQGSEKPSDKYLQFDDIIVEEYVPGQEISVAVFKDKSLGAMGLRPKRGFYDYEAKYSDGITEHIYPAQIPEVAYAEALKFAEDIHKVLGCRTLSRSDFIYNPKLGDQGLYFLEVNTHPGFTKLSILPEIALNNGITTEEILEQLINDAKCDALAQKIKA